MHICCGCGLIYKRLKDSSIHFGAFAGFFSLYIVFHGLYLCLTTSLHSVLTVDNMCCAFLKQKENVWWAGPNMRDWKKGERRAGDCISPNGQWNESQYCVLWEEEAPCLFPTHRPLFSTNTLLRSTFSLVRTLWRAFNLLMTTMNN